MGFLVDGDRHYLPFENGYFIQRIRPSQIQRDELDKSLCLDLQLNPTKNNYFLRIVRCALRIKQERSKNQEV
jgi:hypothetical protein